MRTHRRMASWIAGLMALAGPGHGRGLEYTLDGGLSLGQEYNSNIQLLPEPQSAWGTSLNGNAALSARAENWGGNGRLRLENYFYSPDVFPASNAATLPNSSDSSINRQNQYFDAAGYYLTERSRFEVAGNFIDDFLLSNQAANVNGLLIGKVHRTILGINPSWTYALDELTQGSVGYSYSHIEYDYPPAPVLFPNADTHAVFAKLSRRWTEKLTAIADLSYTAYRADASYDYSTVYAQASGIPGFRSARPIDYVSFSLGGKYQHDESLDAWFSVGGQYNHVGANFATEPYPVGVRLVDLGPPPQYELVYQSILVNSQPATDTLGPIFSLGANKQFERDRLGFSYGRQISPSVNSLLLAVDRVTGTWQHQFLEDLTGNLGFSFNRQEFINGGNGGAQTLFFPNLSFYTVDCGLTYNFSKNWSVRGSYQYLLRVIEQNSTVDGADIDNNQVYLSLNYTFDPLKF